MNWNALLQLYQKKIFFRYWKMLYCINRRYSEIQQFNLAKKRTKPCKQNLKYIIFVSHIGLRLKLDSSLVNLSTRISHWVGVMLVFTKVIWILQVLFIKRHFVHKQLKLLHVCSFSFILILIFISEATFHTLIQILHGFPRIQWDSNLNFEHEKPNCCIHNHQTNRTRSD